MVREHERGERIACDHESNGLWWRECELECNGRDGAIPATDQPSPMQTTMNRNQRALTNALTRRRKRQESTMGSKQYPSTHTL